MGCVQRGKEGTPLTALATPGPWASVLMVGRYGRCFWTGVPDLLRNCQEDLGSLDAEASVPCLPSAPSLMCSKTCMPRVLRPSYWVTKPALAPQGLSVSLSVIRPWTRRLH